MINLTLHRLMRFWRKDLAILLCLALGSTVMISLSGYQAVISNRELHQVLAAASPAERSLLITGSLDTFDATLDQDLQKSLGAALKERIEIRYATLLADPQPASATIFDRIDVYSFDPIAGHVHLVEGRMPEPMRLSEAIGPTPPQAEALIGVQAAGQAGYRIGDRISASGSYHRFVIVGIVEPLDVNDDAWGGDLSAFRVTGEAAQKDRTLPLIIPPLSMQSNLLRPIFPHQISWRITLNQGQILSAQVENLRGNLINFDAQAGTRGAAVTSDLIGIFDDYQAELAPVRTLFFMLGLQSVTVLLFALAALASTWNQSLRIERSAFYARGASRWQTFGPIALETFILAVFASLVCAPGLARLLIQFWGRDLDPAVSGSLSGNIWLLSAVLVGAGWLGLTLPPVFAPHLASVRNRPPQRPWVQRYSLDVYLFVFAGLLTWQLSQSGSFLTRQLGNNTRLFDPLLVAGPSLLLAACAMLAIRLLSILARSVSWLVGHFRGSVLHLGFLRLTRDIRHAGWILLLVGMVSAQCVFDQVLLNTLASNSTLMPAASLDQGLRNVLQIHMFTLALFTFSLLFLLSFYTLQQRLDEFRVLRMLGLSPRQGRFTLDMEALLSLFVGILLGTILGLALSVVLFPYLAQAFGQVAINPFSMDGRGLVELDLLLLCVFGGALLLPLTCIPAKGWSNSPQGAE